MLDYITNPYFLVNVFWMFTLYSSVNNICHWFGTWKHKERKVK
jgi:hypothetical protein